MGVLCIRAEGANGNTVVPPHAARKGPIMATVNHVPENVREFVMRYYSPDPDKRGTIERKPYARFKAACESIPGAPDNDEAIAAIFERYTGLTPMYSFDHDYHTSEWYDKMQQAVAMLTLALDDTYRSVSDLFARSPLRNKIVRAPWDPISYALPDEYNHVRKCFKDMAAQGLIDCLEIETCGKCAIRLYKLKNN